MNKTIKNILKIFLVGLATTVVRIIWQLSIPAGKQTVPGTQYFRTKRYHAAGFYCLRCFCLLPDCRVVSAHPDENGWESDFAGAEVRPFLLCRMDRLSFRAICRMWLLWTRITYPIADSLALIVMGLLLGWLFGNPAQQADKANLPFSGLPALAVTGCFLAGRMIQYFVFDVYSSFDEKPLETVLWCLLTGIATSCVMVWLNRYVDSGGRIKRALILGGLLFGVNLVLFNFFMPLVFAADIPDLILRSFIDILAVTVGCLSFSNQENANPADWGQGQCRKSEACDLENGC